MKAVRFDRYGDVDVLHVADVSIPEPAQGEVLVKVKAASINPGEAKIREGVFHKVWPASFPSGEGSDLAGIVTRVGIGVGGVATGDEVIGFTHRRASHAEYVVVEAQNLARSGAQDTFYVGNLKGVGRIYQQTFIDTYTKVVCAKLYDRKTPITAADLLNDRVLPLFESLDIKPLRILTDRGSEYCGNPERHEYELYLAIEDIDHSRTKTKSPQTNGICERFHRTVLNEFYRVAFRKKVYRSIDELQTDLDSWIKEYNEARSHQGRWCFGKTPMQTFLDAMPMTKEKMIAA